MSEEKKYKNLSTYVVCMILAVIILIIFAAMADNREEHFKDQLNEKEQVNVSIQNQIVSLSDENYHLKKNAEETAKELEAKNQELQVVTAMKQAWQFLAQGDKTAANEVCKTLEGVSLTEEQQAEYTQLQNLMQ